MVLMVFFTVLWFTGLLLIHLTYGILIGMADRIFRQLTIYTAASTSRDAVTVIIAARNEEKYIARCLASVLAQDLPREQVEIIVVDDHSEDRTAEIVGSFANQGVRLIRLVDGQVGKKAALGKGIAAATHAYIAITDADCTHPSGWLNTLLNYRETNNAVFVAAPVVFRKASGFLERFQSLDFLSLQGITAIAPQWKLNMCNGANLLYTKSSFEQVEGFAGIDRIATGDDMLLMEKMNTAFPGRVGYCFSRDAIVVTEPASGWVEFIQQRIRWASKSTNYAGVSIKLVLLAVYLLNLSMVVLLIAGLFSGKYMALWLIMGGLKISFELPFMIRTARFFERANLIPWFLPMQPLHSLYTVMAGTFGLFKSYRWKGRKVY